MRITNKARMAAVLFLTLLLVPMSTSAQNSMVELVIPYSNSSTAYAINELDQVAGTGIQSLYFGFLWDNGNVRRIYGFSGWYTEAYDINDWKQVVGESYSDTGYHAILWENGIVSDLGTLGGFVSAAYGINNLGQVVGVSQTWTGGPYTGPGHAFLWEDGVMSDLGTLGGSHSAANDINDLSQVVGYSQTAAS